MTGVSTRRDRCRLCGGARLPRVLLLGKTPLANAFVPASARGVPQPLFPLDLNLCLECGHLQLLEIVPPELLFRDYVYVSGTSPVFVEHFHRYAQEVVRTAGLKPGDSVIDIGSNDGTLLRLFQEKGMRVLGIDPALKIAEEASRRGIPTLPEFFTPALAERLAGEGWRPAAVTANNVFAHADDLAGIARGIRRLLTRGGCFFFEVSYGLEVFRKGLFDTIYHEHLSYHTVKPLVPFFRKQGLRLTDALEVESHGGSLRGVVRIEESGAEPQRRVEERIAEEEASGFYDPASYERFAQRIFEQGKALKALLVKLKGEGKRIIGFGAPAKATTLMYHFGIGADLLEAIVDDSPWKQGLLSPGLHIPVVPAERLYDPKARPDYCLVLAWNFVDSILKRHRAFQEAGGHFIVPLPKLEVR